MKKIIFYSGIGLFIDQVIKIIIESFLFLHESIVVIPHFFSLTYVRNDGAAFGLFSGNRIFFIFIAIFAVMVFYFWFLKNKTLHFWETITYSILLSGILGNLIDRIFRGYVVDYLSFTFFSHSFPIFNFADICIVLATIGMILFMRKDG